MEENNLIKLLNVMAENHHNYIIYAENAIKALELIKTRQKEFKEKNINYIKDCFEHDFFNLEVNLIQKQDHVKQIEFLESLLNEKQKKKYSKIYNNFFSDSFDLKIRKK